MAIIPSFLLDYFFQIMSKENFVLQKSDFLKYI